MGSVGKSHLSGCIKFPNTHTLLGSLQVDPDPPGYNLPGFLGYVSVLAVDVKTFLRLCVSRLEFASCCVLFFVSDSCVATDVLGIDLSHKLYGVY